MLRKQFNANFSGVAIGRRTFKIENDAIHSNQDVQVVSKHRLFLGGHVAKSGTVGVPVTAGRRGRHAMNRHNGQRQTINDTLTVLGNIQTLANHSPNEIEGLHKPAPTTVETALRRNDWKQIAMFLPVAEHLALTIPAAAFANQGHRRSFAI